jgi:hypothetical protein
MASSNIVVVPFPALGHINPFLGLTKLLIPHGFTFTILVPDDLAPALPNPNPNPNPNHNPRPGAANGDTDQPREAVEYVPIPAMSAAEAARLRPSSPFLQHIEVLKSMRPAFDRFLKRQQLDNGNMSCCCCCVMGDCFVPWISEAASAFGLPAFVLFTSSAHAMSVILHVDELLARGIGSGAFGNPQAKSSINGT